MQDVLLVQKNLMWEVILPACGPLFLIEYSASTMELPSLASTNCLIKHNLCQQCGNPLTLPPNVSLVMALVYGARHDWKHTVILSLFYWVSQLGLHNLSGFSSTISLCNTVTYFPSDVSLLIVPVYRTRQPLTWTPCTSAQKHCSCLYRRDH